MRPSAFSIPAVLLATLIACSRTPGEPVELPTPSSAPTGAAASSTVFAVKGDWGAGTLAQRRVSERMCAQHAETPFAEVLTVGDNFYAPDGIATARTYGRPERCLRRLGVTWRPAWGNHDVSGRSTRIVLGAPDRWYSWEHPGVAFFVLDSNQVTSREQRRWLARHLRDETAPVKIVAFHHPPFTVGGPHAPNALVRDRWVPLFERYDVTLVLNGHQHVYEHHRVRGVEYVVTGGGGAGLYSCGAVRGSARACREAWHFLIVTASATGVRVRAIDEDGDVFDQVRIAV